jgi:hypothetical protein
MQIAVLRHNSMSALLQLMAQSAHSGFRHNRLSAAINVARKRKPSHACAILALPEMPPANMSTRTLTPYCAPTEQPTAATTAATMTVCATGRIIT